MATVGELLQSGSDLPGDSPRRDIEILLGHCLNKPRTWLYTWPDFQLTEDATAQFLELLGKRRAGHPVAYLTGEREFWTLNLAVNDATLIPRPETETLVEWALELSFPDTLSSTIPRAIRALDLGTGSGAIALAVASERAAWSVSAVDSSESALAMARINAVRNNIDNVDFVQSCWFDALNAARFELILANPPYIDGADPHLERGDVRFEPRSALVAADDGLADLAHIVEQAPGRLVPGGWLLLEHGFEQGAAVRNFLERAHFEEVATRCDLAGHERVTGGRTHAH